MMGEQSKGRAMRVTITRAMIEASKDGWVPFMKAARAELAGCEEAARKGLEEAIREDRELRGA